MKKIISAGAIAITSLVLLAGCSQQQPIPTACTEEAKLCPDGSYVGRTGPSCEFEPCPEAEDKDVDTTVPVATAPATKIKVANNDTLPSFCADTPTPTDIGRDIYPIEIKYINLGFLGQIFTAYKCGPERVDQIFGVEGTDYTLGSTIWLRDNPTQSLIDTFKSIGFTCDEESPDATCKTWKLLDTVKVDDLIKLEPFYQNFEADDCQNCG